MNRNISVCLGTIPYCWFSCSDMSDSDIQKDQSCAIKQHQINPGRLPFDSMICLLILTRCMERVTWRHRQCLAILTIDPGSVCFLLVTKHLERFCQPEISGFWSLLLSGKSRLRVVAESKRAWKNIKLNLPNNTEILAENKKMSIKLFEFENSNYFNL